MTCLRDLGDWSGGNTPSKANAAYWTDGTIPWVSPKDMKVDEITSSEDQVSEVALKDGRVSMIPEGSLLVVTRSGILSHTLPVAVTKTPVTINQDLKALTPKPGVLPKYVAHALRGASRRILKECSKHGTTVASIETNALLDFKIPLVALDEQRRIVAEVEKQFSRLDEAVANLKRVKANFTRYRDALLSAALAGTLFGLPRLQPDESRPAIAPDVQLPLGWMWGGAAEVCGVVASGSTPQAAEMTPGQGEVPFIKVYNLTFNGALDFSIRPTFIRRAIHEGRLGRSRCYPGDVLMNIVGPPLGKVSVVPVDYPEWNINQAIVAFRPGPRLANRLLAYWLMSPPVQRCIAKTAKATAGQFNVQVSTCRKLALPLPPLAEQHRIVAELDRRLSIVREVEAEVDANLQRAQALRQAVLARAFAGGRQAAE